MRVVFFGTPAFAVPSLNALIEAGVEVAAVVTQPDRPRTRSHSTLVPSPVKARALEAGLRVLQPQSPHDAEFYDEVRALACDLGVVVAYGHLLRPELLAIPSHGFANVHASLLPRWRGAAPIQWALLSGDQETGVTIMRVERGLDTGAVWHERDTAISEVDTTATLTERLSQLGAEALVEALPRITAGTEPVEQGDAGATHAPKVDRELARIRWDESAAAVSCRIRAMDPAPGAWTTMAGMDVKIVAVGARHAALLHRNVESAPPGSIARVENTIHVATGDGTIEVTDVQPAGKRRMSATDWLRGANVHADVRFE